MAFVHLPGRWKRQPAKGVGINWANPLAQGLHVLVKPHGGGGWDDLVWGTRPLITSGATGFDEFGLAYKATVHNSGALNYVPPNVTPNVPLTIFLRWRPATTSFVGASPFAYEYYPEASFIMQFLISGGFWTLNSAFFILATSTVAAEVGKIFNIAGTSYSTTSHTIAVNGVVEPPGAGAGAQGGGPPQRVHIGNVGSFYNVSGSYDFGAVWARALSVNELALLTRDPYQLFRPLQRRIYVSVAGGGQTIAVGQVTETDLAQAIAWAPKRRLVNQVSETDLAQAMGRLKTRAVGQVSETDLAQAITWAPKNRLVNQVTETDLAQAMGRLKSRTIGQVSETDLAQVVSPTAGEQVIQVGQVSETDLAQAMGRLKTRAVGQVSETDLARGIARLKAKTIGQISETDLAQPIAWAPKKRLVGQVTETDIAFPITVVSTAAPAAGIDPSPLFIADVGKTVGM